MVFDKINIKTVLITIMLCYPYFLKTENNNKNI